MNANQIQLRQWCRMLFVLVVMYLSGTHPTAGQPAAVNTDETVEAAGNENLTTFVIEREVPGAGNLTAEELKGASRNSCSVIRELGPGIVWLHSYVTEDKIFCVYRAKNEELIRLHAQKAGIPANSIRPLVTMIGPATAD
jgi:hypothetical protein